MHAGVSARTFGLLVTLAGFFVFVAAAPHYPPHDSPSLNVVQPRQGPATNTSPAAATATSANPATSQASQTSAAASSTSPAAQASSTPTSQQQQQQTSAQQQTSQSAASTTPSSTPTSSTTPTPITSAVVTTDKGGQVVTNVIVISDSPSSSPSPSPSSSPSNSTSSGDSGISTSTIIGLSVAGGVAVIGLIGFFMWKFGRKRIGGYDSNEEIKWPELNAHDTAVPLPTNRTGGAGFDTVADAGRSSVGYAPSTAANSMADLNDPYAVPPLPPNDPNQTFRDDPNSALYDPYYGPIPNTFNQAGPGESIPMTQFAGRRSPGPGVAYGASVGGRVSPGPQVAYGGDASGRASPGPRAPYSGGRVSPGPQAAYGGNAYGPR